MRRYEEAYPRIPKEEIRGSCVTHPSGKYEDGSPWLWLLDSKHVVQHVVHLWLYLPLKDVRTLVDWKSEISGCWEVALATLLSFSTLLAMQPPCATLAWRRLGGGETPGGGISVMPPCGDRHGGGWVAGRPA